MAHWLYKSEPSTWSWDAQVAEGKKGTHWNGVRNHVRQAEPDGHEEGPTGLLLPFQRGQGRRRNRRGDREYYPDHTDETGKFGMVDIKAVKALQKPVTLEDIKKEPRLKDMILVNDSHSRCSR